MATATTPPPGVAQPDDDRDALYEVVGGQVVEKTMGVYEAEIATLLLAYLVPFVQTHRLGKVVVEALFRIDPAGKQERRPDVAFVSDARWPHNRRAPKQAAWDLVPDLAIEIISPTNRAAELVALIDEYFRAGVRCVWVVYPNERRVHVYDSPTAIRGLTRDDTLDGGTLLPGFQLPLASLFEGDDESP
jgi:Uma2 family endonuclease